MRSAGLIALAFVALSDAVANDQSLQGFEACLEESSDTVRLACYDRIAERKKAERDPLTSGVNENVAPGNSIESQLTPSPRYDELDEFGMNAQVAEARKDQIVRLDEIHAMIVAIRTKGYGERVISLDNGQVWEEKSLARALRLKTGAEVRIVSGAMGSFRLFGSGKRSTRVERIR